MMVERMKAYLRLMRFHRPVGIFLLLWPTLWAVWIGGNGKPSFGVVLIFTMGVIVMRAAGCVVNDLLDRTLDQFVRRTQDRPLVTGEVSLMEAMACFVLLCSVAFCLVLLLNNFKTLFLAIVALFLGSIYPLMKRYTHWPQLVLGIAWYIGVLMAFTAQRNQIPLVAWVLYGSVISWAIAYDTMYAMVDRADDLLIGVKSTALLFGTKDGFWIGVFQCVTLLLWILTGFLWKANIFYYLSLVGAAALFIYQQWLIKNREEALCLKAFLNNQWVGFVVFLGVLVGKIKF